MLSCYRYSGLMLKAAHSFGQTSFNVFLLAISFLKLCTGQVVDYSKRYTSKYTRRRLSGLSTLNR